MNLFSKYLSRNTKNQSLAELVKQWDALEILIITIFKSKQVTIEDKQTFLAVNNWFSDNYQQWQAQLEPQWQGVLAGGEVLERDPFLEILDVTQAEDYLDNWRAMQLLAAARESLNKLLATNGSV